MSVFSLVDIIVDVTIHANVVPLGMRGGNPPTRSAPHDNLGADIQGAHQKRSRRRLHCSCDGLKGITGKNSKQRMEIDTAWNGPRTIYEEEEGDRDSY